MTNSWSLLFDQLNMSNQDFWKEDEFSMTGNPGTASSDTIMFNNSRITGGMGDDHISFIDDGVYAAAQVPYNFGAGAEDTITFNLNQPPESSSPRPANGKRYSEDEILQELKEYINGTYRQHYSAGSDRIQTLDLIEACGDGEAFCRSNILKYASRYDKKGTARRDIMKILHYAVLLMHFNDKNAQRETYPQ